MNASVVTLMGPGEDGTPYSYPQSENGSAYATADRQTTPYQVRRRVERTPESDALAGALAGAVEREGLRGERLLRLSMTLPPAVTEVDPVALEFLRRSEDESHFLAGDRRRKDGSQHVFGVGVTRRTNLSLVRAWCEVSGGDRRGQLVNVMRGWNRYVGTGDTAELREELQWVSAYALKPWPLEYGTRGANDFYISGSLLPAYGALRGRGGLRAVEVMKARLHPSSAGQWCLRCGVSLAHRRAGAATCGNACRMALSRSRRSAGVPS